MLPCIRSTHISVRRRHLDSWPAPRATYGFTLLELLISLTIVAILTAVAWPAYSSYIQQSRRTDAVIAIRAIQLAEEKYRANNISYTATLSQLNLSSTSTNGYYSLTVSSPTATGYLVQATAVTGTSQAKDSTCTTIQLQQTGTITTTSPSACWVQ